MAQENADVGMLERVHARLQEIEVSLNFFFLLLLLLIVCFQSDQAVVRAAKILYGLGFDSKMQQMRTNEFSGGWRMRLALARALFCDYDVLLLDEPTS